MTVRQTSSRLIAATLCCAALGLVAQSSETRSAEDARRDLVLFVFRGDAGPEYGHGSPWIAVYSDGLIIFGEETGFTLETPNGYDYKRLVLGKKELQELLEQHEGLHHLRINKRGKTVYIVSGEGQQMYKHARLSKLGNDVWGLSVPRHTGRWEKTPFMGTLSDTATILTQQLGFYLAPI